MRDLAGVIDRCLEEVPEGYDGLFRKAKYIKENIPYTAPEIMRDRWGDWINALSSELGNPDTPWKKTISNIMAGVG